MHNISYWKHGLIMGSTKHYAYSECGCGIVNNSDVEGGFIQLSLGLTTTTQQQHLLTSHLHKKFCIL